MSSAKALAGIILLTALLGVPAFAQKNANKIDGTDNLYRVFVASRMEALRLSTLQVNPVLRLSDGYLVLADETAAANMAARSLKISLIATDIKLEQLAVDISHDNSNRNRYEMLFEQDQLRLFRVDPTLLRSGAPDLGLSPVFNTHIRIGYSEPPAMRHALPPEMLPLDSIKDLVSKDSLISYSERLQAFFRRPAGSDSNHASRDWLVSKFQEFGYDSVVLDTFFAYINEEFKPCENVLAYRVGTRVPNHHLIVGAHRDGVPNSPAADDNGSGVAAVLEIARILKDIPTNVTIIFALFDAEEIGLLGSWHYADEAAAEGDTILWMINMDMIAHLTNTGRAKLYYGPIMTYTNFYDHLADSLCGLQCNFSGSSSYSDHHPFIQNGFDATFVQEYNFSTVYHSPQDSTTYMSFKYLQKVTQASLLAAYAASQSYNPFAISFGYPLGIPQYIPPDIPMTMEVVVTGKSGGIPVPGTGTFHYSLNGQPIISLPMTQIAENHYSLTFPPAPCYSWFEFYFSAEELTNGIFYDTLPEKPHQATVIQSTFTLLQDNFELDQGWTVNGDATDGHWERGVPAGDGMHGDPITDFDGSGSCYLTGNRWGFSDVDWGTTNLISPVFDLSSGSGMIHYARWYSNYLGVARDDVMRVLISNDNGQTWHLVETVGPIEQAEGGWYERTILTEQ